MTTSESPPTVGPTPTFDDLREAAWQIEQDIARNEYLGYERDLGQIQRDLRALAQVVIALIDKLDGEA